MNAQGLLDQPKAPESKPGLKPVMKDDLKSLLLAEVQRNWTRRLTASPKLRLQSG